MNREESIRSAALALRAAILDGQAAGLHVDWPRQVEELERIQISETTASILIAAQGEVKVEVTVPSEVPDEVLTRAKDRALTAATEVIAQAVSASEPTAQPSVAAAADLEAMTKADIIERLTI